MMQSNYLCVVLLVKRKKLSIVIVFTWSWRPRVKPAYNSEWREIWYGLVDTLKHLLQFPQARGGGFHATI